MFAMKKQLDVFFDARQPKARSERSRRLAKATTRDYATVAEYNKPLLRGHLFKDKDKI